MTNIIEFKDVVKEFRSGEHVLKAADNLNFSISKGKFVVVLGPSGAGKSTMLNLLGGLDSLTSGKIYVNGKNIGNYDEDELTKYRANNIGFIFQFYNLISNLNVLENVELMKDIVNTPIDGTKILESVGLKNHEDQFPSQLSGGEQQRVAIARALTKNPEILLCDEPTGALDSKTGVKILSLLQNMSKNKGTTVVIVTHNAILANAADKIIKIKNGKIEDVIINEEPMSVEEIKW